MSETLVHVAFEKTGGRSMRRLLGEEFGEENIYHYLTQEDRVIRGDLRAIVSEGEHHRQLANAISSGNEAREAFQRYYTAGQQRDRENSLRPEDVPKDAAVITGHFKGDRFLRVFPVEDNRYITLLRDPLARLVSHYDHFMKGQHGMTRHRLSSEIDFRPDLTLAEFANIPGASNFQTRNLGISVEEFSTVGVLPAIDPFLEQAGLVQTTTRGEKVNATPAATRSETIGQLMRDNGLVQYILEQNQDDLTLYEGVCAEWDIDPTQERSQLLAGNLV
jgi:hypothetical protein